MVHGLKNNPVYVRTESGWTDEISGEGVSQAVVNVIMSLCVL
jgi:hypothetical protein